MNEVSSWSADICQMQGPMHQEVYIHDFAHEFYAGSTYLKS